MDELSFDKYHQNVDRIYRVNSSLIEPEKTDHTARTPMLLGPALKENYPEIEQTSRCILDHSLTMLKNEGIENFVENVYYVDSTHFSIFSCPFIVGDPNSALVEPYSIVLSRSTSLLYFKNPEDALGKSLAGENDNVYKITGVMEDVPLHSHILYNALISSSTISELNSPNFWGNFGAFTYILVRSDTNIDALENKLSSIYPTYQKEIFEPYGVKMEYNLLPISDIHLKSNLNMEPQPLGNMAYIYTFSAIAFLLLLIACINYMNLTTARSARRAKEIGIRKVSGSVQGQLVWQFLTESMLVSFIAYIISILCILVLIPYFNDISGKTFNVITVFNPKTMLYTLGIVLASGFIGGSYPAFFLSKFNPIAVLKGKLSKASSNVGLRKGLVVVQFAVSITMLIATWVIYGQLDYLRTLDLGYDKENMLVIKLPNAEGSYVDKLNYIKNEALKYPEVKHVSTSYYTPGTSDQNYTLLEIESEKGFVAQGMDNFGIDENYLDNFGMEISEGRNFQLSDKPDSSTSVLVNQAFVDKMNWGDNAIGKRIKNQGNQNDPYLYVIGVIKDFHMRSVYNPITPLLLTYTHDNGSIQCKLSGQNIEASILNIEKIFKNVFPKDPMKYSFADENFNAQFDGDNKKGAVFSAFSALTILLAFLGLLGLVTYTIQQRKKEIAIRKIMGADILQIVVLMASSFAKLVGVASIIAFPLAYYFLSKWIDTFTYQSSISPLIFIITALLVLIVTILIVSFHSIKSSLSNHAKTMRVE